MEICKEHFLLSPIYKTQARNGCWFCHNAHISELRDLWKNYPALWAELREIQAVSRVSFKQDYTIFDLEERFKKEQFNVPGAFSSNKGEDFAAVIHETIKIICPQAPPVSVPKHGWPTSGCFTDLGGKWSVAWRVFDAQFWGVPQRRKRITFVADFGGLTAPEILFERQGVPGYSPPSGAPWQRIAAATQAGTGDTGTNGCLPINDKATRYSGGGPTRHGDGAGNGLGVGAPGDPSPTLTVGDHHAVFVASGEPPAGLPCEDS